MRNALPSAPVALNEQPPRRVFWLGGPDVLLALVAATLAGAAYFPIVKGLQGPGGDYRAHAWFAQRFVETGVLLSPSCLLHLLVAAIVRSGLLPSFQTAHMAVVIVGYASLGAALYLCARRACETEDGRLGRILPFVVAMALPFVQPAVPWKSMYTIGYIWAEPYNSPTYVLLKPLALASAAFAVRFLAEPGRDRWTGISLCAIAVAAGTLAKPSFAICALPAVVICSAYNYFTKARFSRIAVLFGFVVPALAVLIWQYHRTYWSGVPSEIIYRDSLIFAPLAVMRLYSTHLAAQYVLSILFPLSVVALYGKRAWADHGLRFSLIAFAFGTGYAYTLAERIRFGAGNFLWSAYVTLFLLHYFAALFLARQITSGVRTPATLTRVGLCLSTFAWQLASGISVHVAMWQFYR